jgi:hypothetical protein
MLIDQLADAQNPELATLMGKLPPGRTEYDGVEVRLTGLVVFGPPKATEVALASLVCQDCKPPSSTSTEP